MMGVHNEAENAPAAIESVLGQEGVDLELVIVDDGSSDATRDILRDFAKCDPRIRLIEQSNQGLTRALIEGCQAARGDYIARQDAGDLSLPGRLRVQTNALRAERRLSFVSCWTEFRGPELEYLYTVKDQGGARIPTEVMGRDAMIEGPSSHGSVMFRREHYQQVGGYRDAFFLAQDWDLWYRLAEIGLFQMIPEVLFIKRVMPRGRSAVHRSLQHRLGEYVKEASRRRRAGGSDREVLERARLLRPPGGPPPARSEARAYYFL